MNEDDVVAAIAALTQRSSSRIRIGIGDDAAVWQPSRSNRSVITTDALIEGVHFSLDWMSKADAGWRAMAANASDVAAMGARPVLATVAFGIPASAGQDAVLEWYRGMDECARVCGLEIAGGDLTRAPVWTVAVTVVGEVAPTHLKLRSSARPGDAIIVTGQLGSSRAGLYALMGRVVLGEEEAREALHRHRRPQARVDEGRWLGASRHVRAMIDCSDGLSTDLARLCRASGVGARIENIPVSNSAREAARQLGESADAFALSGGEDFELVATVSRSAYPYLAQRFEARFGRPLHKVGSIEADGRILLAKEGVEKTVSPSGWDHFALSTPQ